ncbi:MAG: polA, partial [Clostridiales bacterium]|nr:polA [Clostridiales bacterium]
MNKKKLVILDGNSLINRAFYALPPMTTSNGQPTGAIYGFTTMLFKIFQEVEPDYIISAFDRKAPTFRHLEYKEYKAGRKKMPDELALQLDPLKKLLSAFNIGILEIDGYEADDIIGTISKKYEASDLEVLIYTGDRDALQLVSDDTRVMFTKKGISEIEVYDKSVIKAKYGFSPEGIIDLKGLMGDASDNIPGVVGVGEKTALKLLSEYGNVEEVYENIDKITGVKLKENLELHKSEAFLSKKLATIDRNVPIDIDIESAAVNQYDAKQVREIFKKYEFRSLMEKLKINDDESTTEMELPDIKPYDGNISIIQNIINSKTFNFIMEFNEKNLERFIINGNYSVDKQSINDFKNVFECETILKNTFGAKHVYNYLGSIGIEMLGLDFDFEIASYLLNPSESKYDVTSIMEKFEGLMFSGNNQNENQKVLSLFVSKMDSIKEKMLSEIDRYGMRDLFYKVEMPLVRVLSELEAQGFMVDKEILNQIGFQLSEDIDSLTAHIYDLAGEEFNINSPKQLGVILFEKLMLPIIKKTKTGYSTNAEVLEELSSKHEIIDKILNYRQLVKLKSTYIDGLLGSVSDDGKIHSSFNQTVTTTGRISSTEPNLQNIPVKLEQGKRIRKAFIPALKNRIILSADYSQIELRVLAHISKDENLIDAFKNNQDIHKRTAAEILNIPMDEVTSTERSRAKAINFGIVYGLSDFGLSRDIKIPIKEAKKYIDNYFERYKGVKEYLDIAIRDGKTNGYVKTLMNRLRYIPEINSSNRNVKMLGERLAMNTPIQGTAADIIKIAMVNVSDRIKNEKLNSRLILQVHDELVLEVEKNELEIVKKIVKEEMERAITLEVPLIVDV